MTDAERIELLRDYCQSCHYPEALTNSIYDYMRGEGALAAVRKHAPAALDNIFARHPMLLNAWNFGRHTAGDEPGQLDALDLRLLDVCLATNQVWACLQPLMHSPVLQPALAYLLGQGMLPGTLLQGPATILYHTVTASGALTTLGETLMALLPSDPHVFAAAALFAAPAWPQQHHGMYPWLVRMLLSANPPLLDHAQRLVEELAEAEETQQMDTLGRCAVLLFGADPRRFTPLLRSLAGPDSRASLPSRLKILLALLEDDPAQHADLAVEVLRGSFTIHHWNLIKHRREVLQVLAQFDLIRFLPLFSEAARALESWEAEQSLRLLAQAPFDSARPHLQACVAEGGIAVASQALQTLLSQQWQGRQEYAVSLLTHRYQRIRKEATAWLAPQGDAVLAGIGPYLTQQDASVRLSAIDALAALGGERAHALLRTRLDQEPSAKVRQAIFGVIGLPAEQRASSPLTKETLLVQALATLRYVSKPAPRWFVATEVPALLWADNEPVPSGVLLYLVYRQSFVTAPATLDDHVSQALPLFNRSTTVSLANYLFRGWIEHGYSAKEAWCIPLICALGDDALLPALALRVEDWSRDNRRKLAIRILQALPLFESQVAIAELRGLATGLRRGVVKTAAKATLATVAP